MTAGTPGRLGLVVFAIIASPRSSWPDEPPPVAKEVQQILEIAWKPSQVNFAAAKPHYEAAKQMTPGDVRVSYAMALVAIKRYRMDDASKYLDEALANEKPLLPIRRVKFWLVLQHKDQAAQMAVIRKLTSILASNSAMADRADYQETARWLGVVLGYYAGPGKSQLLTADREALDAEVSGQLKGPWAISLAEGKNSVGVQFKKLQADLSDSRKQVKAKNEAKRAENRRKNDDDLQDCNGKLRTAQLELVRIQCDKDNSPVLGEYDVLQNERIDLKKNRPSPPQQAGKDYDKNEEAREKRDYEAKLDEMDRRLSAIEARLTALYPQLQKIQAQHTPFLAILREQEPLLQTLTKQQKHLALPVMENDDATLALDIAAKSFTTYGGINLEQEKQRILESYGTK